MKILIRVDGTSLIGSGHISRCLVLASEFRNQNCCVEFVCFNYNNNLNYLIQDKGFKVHIIKIEHENWAWEYDINWINTHFNQNSFDLLIVDHYGIDYRWGEEASTIAKKIFVIDDLANRRHECDFLLDQNFVKNYYKRYDKLISKNTIKFLGPKYALLREEFTIQKSFVRYDNTLKNLLITFGGSDVYFAIIKVLNAIRKINYLFVKINLVVSKNTTHLNEIKKICDTINNVELHIDSSKLALLMIEADLCIGAGGITNWERCYFALATVVISISENQVEIAKYLHFKGAIKYLGSVEDISEEKIIICLNKIIFSKNKLSRMSYSASRIVNPNIFLGPKFICEQVVKLL